MNLPLHIWPRCFLNLLTPCWDSRASQFVHKSFEQSPFLFLCILSCGRAVLLVFKSSSESYPICSCSSELCPRGGGELRMFLLHHLDPQQFYLYKSLYIYTNTNIQKYMHKNILWEWMLNTSLGIRQIWVGIKAPLFPTDMWPWTNYIAHLDFTVIICKLFWELNEMRPIKHLTTAWHLIST